MSMRTAELVTEWDSVPFDGGYEGLRTLADREFSGAVVSGPTQLFMLNGRVVGILDGELDDFESGGGTARQAPHDALPLLVVMQDRADEPRAQYYTEETPISDVDRTLTDGKFTGYVELSENVLSGDYYLVYHQGRSMSVAWVGSSERLITDDEAFEQANDEVGIYDVMPAEIEPIELPEPEPESGSDTAVGGVSTGSTEPAAETEPEPTSTGTAEQPTAADDDEFTEPALETDASDAAEPTESVTASSREETGSNTTPSGPPGSKAAGASQGSAVDSGPDRSAAETEPATDAAVETTDVDPDSATEDRTESSSVRREDRDTGVESTASETTTDTTSTARESAASETTTESESAVDTTQPSRERESSVETAEPDPQQEPTDTATEPTRDVGAASTETERGVAERSDPEPAESTSTGAEGSEPTGTDSEAGGNDTVSAASTPSGGSGAAATALETRSIPSLDPERSSSDTEPSPSPVQQEPATEPTPTTEETPPQSTPEPTQQPTQEPAPQQDGRAEELEAELDERESQIRQLEAEMQELAAENEDLVAERDRLKTELEEARAEIRRLEEQLDSAEMPARGGVQLTATEAIDGTNLFVRYHSKGEATLKKAQDGSAERSAVEENLRLEYHTQFDAEEAVVDGVEFETFLQESIHYRYVNWLVRNLLYEIRDTGHANGMSVLYGALAEIDRAELNGNVSVVYTENGKEHREQEQFDVVVRDRMGNPLVVANINDSREPATDGQMTDIVQTAERVGNSSGSLAGAFLVTSSFFEPEALETAEEATSSGLFSRDKNKSFVNLSRKDGYHLCLLEARNNEFHLAVPEL